MFLHNKCVGYNILLYAELTRLEDSWCNEGLATCHRVLGGPRSNLTLPAPPRLECSALPAFLYPLHEIRNHVTTESLGGRRQSSVVGGLGRVGKTFFGDSGDQVPIDETPSAAIPTLSYWKASAVPGCQFVVRSNASEGNASL